MSEPSAPPSGDLLELLTQIGAAEDPEQAVLHAVFHRAATQDPELPELLRACAIPRSLDATIVGVLRDAPDDPDNARLLELIAGHGFVLPRANGTFVYHDNTRDVLLAEWQSDDEQRAEFAVYNLKLGDFYESRYRQAAVSDNWLAKVSKLMARARPERLQRLTGLIDSTMTDSLIEALYHHLLADPAGGLEFFRGWFFDLERANRAGLIQSLISFARDFLERLPEAEREPLLLLWLQYYGTRASAKLDDYDPAEAEQTLAAVLRDADTELSVWVLDELSAAYAAELKVGDALRTRLELIERVPGVDPYNEPLHHCTAAELYTQLGDYAAAIPQYQLAIEKADRPDSRPDIGVIAGVGLSDVYRLQGDWGPAFESATEALYIARTSFSDDPNLQRLAAAGLANLLMTFDIAAADCAGVEALGLAEAIPMRRHYEVLDLISSLVWAGRIKTARAWADRHQSELDENDADEQARAFFAYRQAMLLEAEGREQDAADLYGSIIATSLPAAGALRASARENRGVLRLWLGDLSGAREDLEAARAEWTRSGCPIHAANMDMRLGELALKCGDAETARAQLAAAQAAMPSGPGQYTPMVLRSEGDLHAWHGDRESARRCYEAALEAFSARRDRPFARTVLNRLEDLFANRSDWPASGAYASRISELSRQLESADGVNRSGRGRPAELVNATAVMSFCATEDRREALETARQQLSSASELDPDNFWPQLNLSFVCAEQQDWLGAIEALEKVFALCPEQMRTTRLARCLKEYVVNHVLRPYGAQSGGPDRARRAVAVLEGAHQFISGLPPEELADLRAIRFGLLALARESGAAQTFYRAAAFEGRRLTGECMYALVEDVTGYWAIDDALKDLADDADLHDAATATRGELSRRLDELLGLAPIVAPTDLPVMTPIIVELGDVVVPLVDPDQDGGRFLNELIPGMKARILESTGITVPGLSLRPAPMLAPNGYVVHIEEVPVLAHRVPSAASFAVLAAIEAERRPDAAVTALHPLTGEPGLWSVVAVDDGVLDLAGYFLHQLELVLRSHLVRFLGPQEVDGLVDSWMTEDGDGLVVAVVPDADARLRLTWVLQSLVEKGISIREWRKVLTAIRDAGGLAGDVETLCSATRAALTPDAAAAAAGREAITVPPELEDAVIHSGGESPGAQAQARQALRLWLRERIAHSGPALTLVAHSAEGRDAIEMLARAEDRSIITLAPDQVTVA